MALTINTNVASLNAQRNLSRSQGLLTQSLQRLSTGLRINSAKDDAAGLAIAERFTTQIRGLNQAARNANDGISLAQTTESVLGELSSNLQRIRELAIQSANATNSASDREALDNEVQQRLDEIDRIAKQTSFNGQKVLDGTFGVAVFQVGANAGETITVNFTQGVGKTQIGQIATTTSSIETTVTALSGVGTIQVGSGSVVTVGASVAGSDGGQTVGSAFSKAIAVNAAGASGLTVTAVNNTELDVTAIATAAASAGATFSLRINGQDIFASSLAANATTAQQVTDSINSQSANTGVTASLNGSSLQLTAADGRDIIVGQTLGGNTTGGIVAGTGGATTVNGVTYKDGTIGTVANATAQSAVAAAVNGGELTFTATENVIITGDGDDLGLATVNFTIALDTKSLADVDVLTTVNSTAAIGRIDAALATVSTLRSELGAVQNRFESTIQNLAAVSESLSASRGRILDADFAAETSALTRAQILQQAGVSVLAQANAQPQLALSLLQ